MTRRTGPLAERGQKRHAATEQALRQAWERLRIGAPTHPELIGTSWQLSISAICLEARCSRNALYDGDPELRHEIQTAIAKERQIAGQLVELMQSATASRPIWLHAVKIASALSQKMPHFSYEP